MCTWQAGVAVLLFAHACFIYLFIYWF